jgi:heme-degrading monooxygenase HmoA
MEVILFRSKLTPEAGVDYDAMDAELQALVAQNPGFIRAKSYSAADGERLTVVWWRDQESLRDWRHLARHREAQETGRSRWYQYYEMEVATVTRTRSFARESPL